MRALEQREHLSMLRVQTGRPLTVLDRGLESAGLQLARRLLEVLGDLGRATAGDGVQAGTETRRSGRRLCGTTGYCIRRRHV